MDRIIKQPELDVDSVHKSQTRPKLVPMVRTPGFGHQSIPDPFNLLDFSDLSLNLYGLRWDVFVSLVCF